MTVNDHNLISPHFGVHGFSSDCFADTAEAGIEFPLICYSFCERRNMWMKVYLANDIHCQAPNFMKKWMVQNDAKMSSR